MLITLKSNGNISIPTERRQSKNASWDAIGAKIQSFTHLPQNWDGYGGIPLSQQVADVCQHFLKSLPETYLQLLQPENVSPSPYGTVTIDWENASGNFVTVEIGKQKANFFARLPGGKSMENEQLNLAGKTLPPDLLEALQDLFSPIPAHA